MNKRPPTRREVRATAKIHARFDPSRDYGCFFSTHSDQFVPGLLEDSAHEYVPEKYWDKIIFPVKLNRDSITWGWAYLGSKVNQ